MQKLPSAFSLRALSRCFYVFDLNLYSSGLSFERDFSRCRRSCGELAPAKPVLAKMGSRGGNLSGIIRFGIKTSVLLIFTLFFTNCQQQKVPHLPLLYSSNVPVEEGESGDFNKKGGGGGVGSDAVTNPVDSSVEEEEEDCGNNIMTIMNQISSYMQAGQYDKASAYSRKCLGQ